MPIFAGVLSGLFEVVFSLFAKKLAIGLAAAAAFLVVSAAALAAAKLAWAALFSSLAAVLPSQVAGAVQAFMPTHASAYIGLILLAQSIMVSFDYWRNNLAVAYQLSNV